MFPTKTKPGGYGAYTRDDISLMLENTNKKRTRVLILFLSSSGCRAGVIPELKLGHITNIENCKKMICYADTKDEYPEFTLSEVQNLHESIHDEKEKIVSKAAYLIKQITKGHFYSGGNKRTALLTAGVFLNLNDYSLKYNEGAGFILTMCVYYDLLNDDKLIEWIRGHMEEKV